MKNRPLGRTGLQVSEIGFGAWAIGGNSYGKTDDAESLRALDAALENGVNFFDTADIYGNGHSEVLLGRAFSKKRDSVILATKVGWDFYHGGTRRNFSSGHIEFACERSLERLQTSHIDIYQLHNPTVEILEKEELWKTLEKLKRSGKIRFIGVSIHQTEEGVAAVQLGKVDTLQVIYNLIDQRPREKLFSFCEANQTGVIVREPFNCGILTGKYSKISTFPKEDHRHGWKREKFERDLDKLEKMISLLPAGNPLPQMALEFILKEKVVSTVIPGAKTAEQVLKNIQASSSQLLSSGAVNEIREFYRSEPLFQEGFFKR